MVISAGGAVTCSPLSAGLLLGSTLPVSLGVGADRGLQRPHHLAGGLVVLSCLLGCLAGGLRVSPGAVDCATRARGPPVLSWGP